MVPVPSSTTLTNSHPRTAARFPVRWSPSLMKKSYLPTKFNHISTKPTPSSIHTFCTCVLIAILLHVLYSSPLPPIIGNILDNTICPTRASLSVLINLLYLPNMADVPSLMMESPINTWAFLAFPCDTTSTKLLSCRTLCPLSLISSTFTVLPPGIPSPLTCVPFLCCIFCLLSSFFWSTLSFSLLLLSSTILPPDNPSSLTRLSSFCCTFFVFPSFFFLPAFSLTLQLLSLLEGMVYIEKWRI